MDTLGFTPHDHRSCIADAVATVESQCKEQGLQLTPVRRRALEILLEGHRALGAYDMLDRLRDDGFKAQPPVAYRALDFLVSNGFAHRIERLNAFVACASPGAAHDPAFLICRACDSVAETEVRPTQGSLGRAARDTGFAIESAQIELAGLCPNCRADA